MRTLLVVGIGVGDPDQLTFEAARAIATADLVLVAAKATAPELVAARAEVLRRHLRPTAQAVMVDDPPRDRGAADYRGAVAAWHGSRTARWAAVLDERLRDGETAAVLVWGDPCLYDGTVRVAAALRAAGLGDVEHRVIPGISSPQALAAAHRTSLHGVGEPVVLTTGRRLVADGGPTGPNTVVMLDGREAFAEIDPEGLHICWGAGLGSADEVLIAGPLAEVADEVRAARRAARTARGWVMDTYLLRREPR